MNLEENQGSEKTPSIFDAAGNGMDRCLRSGSAGTKFSVQELLANLCAIFEERNGGRLPFSVIVHSGSPKVQANLGKCCRILLQLIRVLRSEAAGSHISLEIANRRFFNSQKKSNPYSAPAGTYVEFILSAVFNEKFAARRKDYFAGGEGAPLMLRLISSIIRKENGSLIATSDDEEAHYMFILPAAQASAGKIEKIVTPDNVKPHTIMVADSDPAVLSFLESGLRLKGYSVLAAPDGKKALETFEESKDDVELLFVDASLPRLSGVSLAKTASTMKPGLRVILTGSSDIPESEEALRGIEYSAFISKPYPLSDLFTLIDCLLKWQG